MTSARIWIEHGHLRRAGRFVTELAIVVPAGSSTFIHVLDLCAALCANLPKSVHKVGCHADWLIENAFYSSLTSPVSLVETSVVVKRVPGGARGADWSVRNPTKSRPRVRKDRAVVVHACKPPDTPGVAREQSFFAPKRSVAPSRKVPSRIALFEASRATTAAAPINPLR